MTLKIYRLVVGGESWKTNPVEKDALGDWELWDEDNPEEDPEIAIKMYVDLHEVDGDPPSLWRAVRGNSTFELDARSMTAEQRLSVPEEVRKIGRAMFGNVVDAPEEHE